MSRLRNRIVRIYRSHPLWVWICWAIGAVVLLSTPLAVADPAVLGLLFDPEIIAVFVLAGLMAVRTSAIGLMVLGFLAIGWRWLRSVVRLPHRR
ncbi:MAG TPA: hypothetical protein VGJ28_02840 [Micromonosporaceae bacterium]